MEGLKAIGVHSKLVPSFVLPDSCLQDKGIDPVVGRGLLQLGGARRKKQDEARHDDG